MDGETGWLGVGLYTAAEEGSSGRRHGDVDGVVSGRRGGEALVAVLVDEAVANRRRFTPA